MIGARLSRERETAMEYRLLGHSGLRVSVLSLGAATFGGGTEFYAFGTYGDKKAEA